MIDSVYTDTDKIFSTINVLRKVYVTFIIIGILSMISLLLDISHEKRAFEILLNALILLLDISIYNGLKKKREWVINLVLFTSAMLLLNAVWISVSAANSYFELMRKLIAFVFVFFSVYQIYFFTKKEVKKVFGASGSAFF